MRQDPYGPCLSIALFLIHVHSHPVLDPCTTEQHFNSFLVLQRQETWAPYVFLINTFLLTFKLCKSSSLLGIVVILQVSYNFPHFIPIPSIYDSRIFYLATRNPKKWVERKAILTLKWNIIFSLGRASLPPTGAVSCKLRRRKHGRESEWVGAWVIFSLNVLTHFPPFPTQIRYGTHSQIDTAEKEGKKLRFRISVFYL